MGLAPYYLAAALIACVVYYIVLKKKIFDKHVHSKVLIRAMTINMIINILAVVFCALVIFATPDTKFIFEKLLFKKNPKNLANVLLALAGYVVAICTTITGARISLKRKGHKNLKLERILTSDFVVTGACTALATIGLIISLFFL